MAPQSKQPGAPQNRNDWIELLAVFFVHCIVFASIPALSGGLGMSSDTLNHHIYLGWVADSPRFHRDFLAASYQSLQFPYLYWPVYKLAAGNFTGVQAGIVLASIQALLVPPFWLVAKACIPGNSFFDRTTRVTAVAMGFMTGALLSQFDNTGNDLLSAIPFAWGLAVAIQPLAKTNQSWLTSSHCLWLSAVLAGMSVAGKSSNAVLAACLPIIWWLGGMSWRQSFWRIVIGGAIAVFTFALIYGYWGWNLWKTFGNPVYPMFDDLFEHVRQLTHWQE